MIAGKKVDTRLRINTDDSPGFVRVRIKSDSGTLRLDDLEVTITGFAPLNMHGVCDMNLSSPVLLAGDQLDLTIPTTVRLEG